MSLWVFDTDIFSLYQRGHPFVRQRFEAIASEEVVLTVVSAEEQLRGRLEVIRRASSSNKLILAYRRLWDTLEDLKSINLLEFDQEAYNCYMQSVF